MKTRIKPSPDQIESWVKRNFGDYKSVRSGGDDQIRVNNPLVNDQGKHLWINLSRACVIDFRPHAKRRVSGSFLWFVKLYKKVSFREAVSDVMGSNIYYENVNDSFQYDARENRKIALPDGYKELDDSDEYDVMMFNYLYSRCVSDLQIRSFHIGRCGFDVVFPYFENGDVVYWQSRSILNKIFSFPPDTDKSLFIYGIDNIEPGEPVIVTESIFNALMFDRGASIGGSSLSESQARKLKRMGCDDVIVAFDNDEAGLYGAAKCFDLMGSKCHMYYSVPPDDRDWNKIAQDDGIDRCYDLLLRNTKRLNMKSSVGLKMAAMVN